MANWIILSQALTGDGYDVRFITSGNAYTLHFPAVPSQENIDNSLTEFCSHLIKLAGNDNEEGDTHELLEQ